MKESLPLAVEGGAITPSTLPGQIEELPFRGESLFCNRIENGREKSMACWAKAGRGRFGSIVLLNVSLRESVAMPNRTVIWILVGVAVVSAVVGFQRLYRTNMIEVIGVYPVRADEPCHLVELRVRGIQSVFDFGDFTQEMPGKPRSNWQVPWMERILSPDGTKVVADDFQISHKPELFRGDVRCVFFFHYLDVNRPLVTPLGEVRLSKPSDRPERLSSIQYEEPG